MTIPAAQFAGEDVEKSSFMLRLAIIARNQVLDTSGEVSLLREIKDIEDELTIMKMVFEDQKGVLTILDSVISSQAALRSSTKIHRRRIVETDSADTSAGLPTTCFRTTSFDRKVKQRDNDESKGTTSQESIALFEPVKLERIVSQTAEVPSNQESIPALQDRLLRPSAPTHPLAVAQMGIDDISRMLLRAKKANQALDFLVDLKQKQSNVLDSRSENIQAEQSLDLTQQLLIMNMENKKQGKALMIFTVVTIIFLPMSFMASFFSINLDAFPWNEKDHQSLTYVAKIMFPMSAGVTVPLILFAFKAYLLSFLEDLWTRFKHKSAKVVTIRRQRTSDALPI